MIWDLLLPLLPAHLLLTHPVFLLDHLLPLLYFLRHFHPDPHIPPFSSSTYTTSSFSPSFPLSPRSSPPLSLLTLSPSHHSLFLPLSFPPLCLVPYLHLLLFLLFSFTSTSNLFNFISSWFSCVINGAVQGTAVQRSKRPDVCFPKFCRLLRLRSALNYSSEHVFFSPTRSL